jgi:TolB-like protein
MAAIVLLVLWLLSPSEARAEPPPGQRDFYATLDDTLGDFEFDLKHEAVTGIDNVSVRNIAVSENVPRSFTAHLEDLIVERILRGTKTKVIRCEGCHVRRTAMKNGTISVLSAQGNQKQNAKVARTRGIKHFLDAAFTYQPSGLVMSIEITEAESAVALWSRTYNSETSRTAMLRRGIDMDQLDPSTRKAIEYPAVLQYRLRVDYLFEPDITGPTGCVGFAFQMMERYDNRKKELGFELEYLYSSEKLLGRSTTATVYGPVNLTLLLIHAFNFIASQEDYNQARASFNAGIGGTFATGYLGALIRVGFEWREGKRFATGAILGYRPSSTAFLPIGTGASVEGIEIGMGISYLF